MDNILEPKDTHSFVEIENNDFELFIQINPKGIMCIPRNIGTDSPQSLLEPDTFRFAKWLKLKNEDVNIAIGKADGIKSLHSHDFWMPIVFLSNDVTFQVFLGLVSNYIYDCLKGALKHDKSNVHLEVYYKDSNNTKKFTYSGSIEGLNIIIKKLI